MPFEFEKTKIDNVFIVTPKVMADNRGYFFETYKKTDFTAGGINHDFVQDNQSKSVKGVIRGLHFQKPPFAQAKLVRCLMGKIIDVAVDIDKSSKTYGKYVAIELTEENKKMLYIPENMAHGFSVLSSEAVISYKCSNFYSKECEAGIIYNDPDININWQVERPIISEKDLILPNLKDI